MRLLIKKGVNIILIAYTFALLDYGLSFFALFFFAFVTTLLFPFYFFLIALPLILLSDFLTSLFLLALITLVYFFKPILIKNKHYLIFSYTFSLIVFTIIHISINNDYFDYIDILIKTIFSISVFLILSSNLKIYDSLNNTKEIALISNSMYYLTLLSMSLFSIMINNMSIILLVWFLLFLKSLVSNNFYIFISLIIMSLSYIYLYNDALVTVIFLIVCIYYHQILPKMFFGLFLLLHNVNYIKIFYLDYEYLFLLISVTALFFLYYKKDLRTATSYNKEIIHTLEDYQKYLDICLGELKDNNTYLLLNKRIEEIFQSYCKSCGNFSKCMKNKMKVFNNMKLILTTDIDLHTIKTNKEFSDFTYHCNKFQEIAKLEKIEVKENFSYDSILETKKVITNIIKSCETKTSYQKYDFFINYLTSLGFVVTKYDVYSMDDLFELYLQLDGISESIIKNVIVNHAINYFGKECTYTIIKEIDSNIFFKLFYKPKLKITFEHYNLAKDNDTLPGDNFLAKKDLLGRYVFALSDGMGSGYDAFSESSQVLRLVSKLSSLKLDINTSLDLLENFYSYKKNADMYASLDYLRIDSVNQKAILYKLGSATTYLLSKSKLKILENTNLPLGISNHKEHYNFDLHKNDLLILLTDGVTEHINVDLFEKFLISISNQTTSQMVYEILKLVTSNTNDITDDISVLVIKVA